MFVSTKDIKALLLTRNDMGTSCLWQSHCLHCRAWTKHLPVQKTNLVHGHGHMWQQTMALWGEMAGPQNDWMDLTSTVFWTVREKILIAQLLSPFHSAGTKRSKSRIMKLSFDFPVHFSLLVCSCYSKLKNCERPWMNQLFGMSFTLGSSEW